MTDFGFTYTPKVDPVDDPCDSVASEKIKSKIKPSANDNPSFVILAAGAGTRFGGRPKVLQDLCGKRILDLVLEISGRDEVVIVGNEAVAKIYGDKVVLQNSPTGNGRAFLLGMQAVKGSGPIVVLMGDSPLVFRSDIDKALKLLNNNEVVVGKFRTKEKNMYGRIVEYKENCRIYEPSELSSSEFYNAGWICFRREFLSRLGEIEFIGHEHRITDYVNLSSSSTAIEVDKKSSIGINSLGDYREAYLEVQERIANAAFMRGVDFVSGSCEGLRFDTELGAKTVIYEGVSFGPGVKIGENCTIGPFCYLEHCTIGDGCRIGPFCHIRGGSKLGEECYIGSFCEINRSFLGHHCKSKHFSYIGDGEIGSNVNFGAGTVFCNYNGSQKSKTKVGDRAFLGASSTYVAPVQIGEGTYIGAGTVVRRDVTAGIICVDRRDRIEYQKDELLKDKLSDNKEKK